MITHSSTKLVQEGEYLAEVDIELIVEDGGWSPYLSVEDARKLDTVRQALQRNDLKAAAAMARVYRLVPVAV